MKQQPVLIWLTSLIIIVAVTAAGTGLLYAEDGDPFPFTTVRGEVVEIWGQGWYRYDTPIGALGFAAADVTTLVLAVPMLLISSVPLARHWFLRCRLSFFR